MIVKNGPERPTRRLIRQRHVIAMLALEREVCGRGEAGERAEVVNEMGLKHSLPGVRLHIAVKKPEQLDEIPQDSTRGSEVAYRRDTHGHGRYYGDCYLGLRT